MPSDGLSFPDFGLGGNQVDTNMGFANTWMGVSVIAARPAAPRDQGRAHEQEMDFSQSFAPLLALPPVGQGKSPCRALLTCRPDVDVIEFRPAAIVRE